MKLNYFNSRIVMSFIAMLFGCISMAQNPFEKFIGNWKLKGGKWEYTENGKYQYTIDTARFSNAEALPDNGIVWTYDLKGGSQGKIMWVYNKSENKVYWLSENAKGPMGQGQSVKHSPDSITFKCYFDGSTGYRQYVYKLISEKELFLRASYYENDKPTGDFYGGTWVKE